jgi:hypothetical protein
MDGLVLKTETNGIRLYENLMALPRAWVQPKDTPPGQQVMPARIQYWRPNRVEVEATGPGVLWLAEIAYPGWRVSIDGEQAQLLDTELLRGVRLEPGIQRVEFIFVPTSLYLGLGLCLAAVLLVILSSRIRYIRSWQL